MPCYYPLQAYIYGTNLNGSSVIRFNPPPNVPSSLLMKLPCGTCIGCRLEHSRQWAVRMTHEASLHEENCFLTLTYAPEHLPAQGSLDRSDPQKFMKRLRRRFPKDTSDPLSGISYYGCGEYGSKFSRPHYHLCLFNFDFPDKKPFFKDNGFQYYTSDLAQALWPKGLSVVSSFSFETAAYAARYCTKKVTGSSAEEYYDGRLPEFSMMSTNPAIGLRWIEKYGSTDVFPTDRVVIRRKGKVVSGKPPRYYDKYLEKGDPELYQRIRSARVEAAELRESRPGPSLESQEAVKLAQCKKLIRSFEGTHTGFIDTISFEQSEAEFFAKFGATVASSNC
jgi:hypothetical protein